MGNYPSEQKDYSRQLANGGAPVGAKNTAPVDADIPKGAIVFYLDEAGNNLKVRVKYSNGTLKTATVALV